MKNVDLLITNANIITLDSKNQIAGSVAVSKGRISGIWSQPEPPLDELNMTAQTRVMNLRGATVIPGFIETHNHILACAYLKGNVDCSSPLNATIQDILHAIEEKVDSTSAGEWIQGHSYDDTSLADNRHPTRMDLDQVAPNHPVYITHISGHIAVANSRAFELAGIDAEQIGDNPHFGSDISGRLNGVLYEAPAMNAFQSVLPVMDKSTFLERVGEASQDYVAQGITTNTDAGVWDQESLDIILEAAKSGITPMRLQLMIMNSLLTEQGVFSNYTASELAQEIQKRSNGRARLDSAKLFQDGSIQGLTGALREPYYCNDEVYGDLFFEQAALNEIISSLHKRGFRIAIHGNGDRAIGSILEGFKFALQQSPRMDHRHRIEHVQMATNEDLDKMAELNVAGSFFINHVYYWGQRHEQIFLGPERARRISPLKDAVDRNLLFTLHSDCPVTPISPLFLIWAAVNRQTREGDILGHEQKVDVITALKAMTIDGAVLNFQEKDSGSIEIGKFADFAVLDKDLTAVNPLEIKDIEVLYTIIDGVVEYENKIVRV
ncbi:amidohydrolase [Paenibacillus taichungensis]|uniref:Amidohydrolase n=1 Tax=Paenibacillus taichungensis TaxID=484184 RepID=A0A329QMC3_9BACL|nr:amidohydrolase [Paenibacillus taichungensis]RAW13507.1 amidohydrolase [Paenibacillus taichungensis]